MDRCRFEKNLQKIKKNFLNKKNLQISISSPPQEIKDPAVCLLAKVLGFAEDPFLKKPWVLVVSVNILTLLRITLRGESISSRSAKS